MLHGSAIDALTLADEIVPAVSIALPLLTALALGNEATAHERAGRWSTGAAIATFALGLLAFGLVVAGGSVRGPLFAMDRLSAVMLVLVTGVSSVVHAFAVRYMDADAGYVRFFRGLGFVVSAVCAVVLANNVIILAAGWIGTSAGLYALQAHYRERPAARRAARLMRRAHSIGDIAIVGACIWLAPASGSLRIDVAFPIVTRSPLATGGIVALLAVAALSKSAQIPLHRWLPETMEAPTPVSALMHAGIVNAGGFLLARFSPLVAHAPRVALCIFLIGAATALWGTACMLVRSDVKRGLAYSTMGQMGYMTMQCGLGAFPAAVLHLVAHGIFKATLFLGAGYAVHDRRRALRGPSSPAVRRPLTAAIVATAIVATTTYATWRSTLGASLPPYGWILLTFAALTCAQAVFATVRAGGVLRVTIGCAFAPIALPSYALLVGAFDRFLRPDVAMTGALVPSGIAILVVAVFAAAVPAGWGLVRVPGSVRDRVYAWLLCERLPLPVLER